MKNSKRKFKIRWKIWNCKKNSDRFIWRSHFPRKRIEYVQARSRGRAIIRENRRPPNNGDTVVDSVISLSFNWIVPYSTLVVEYRQFSMIAPGKRTMHEETLLNFTGKWGVTPLSRLSVPFFADCLFHFQMFVLISRN